jgi:hypothetical protein
MIDEYLGTISLSTGVTARRVGDGYELWTGHLCCRLSLTQVQALLAPPPFILSNPPLRLGTLLLSGRELRALWNTMLAYLKQIGEPIDQYINALTDFEFQRWEREQGIDWSRAEALEDDL